MSESVVCSRGCDSWCGKLLEEGDCDYYGLREDELAPADCSLCGAPGGYCAHSGTSPAYDGPAYNAGADEFEVDDPDDYPSREVSLEELKRRIAAKAASDSVAA